MIFVESDQAAGYRTRNKYHVCVCGYQGRYFFINSKIWEGSFRISHADLPALPNSESHIACNTLLTVSDEYMRQHAARVVGKLTPQTIEDLIDHIEACGVLTEHEKEIAIDGFTGALYF